MRIAFVAPSVHQRGGVPNYVASLSRSLAHDDDVHVMTRTFDVPGRKNVSLHRVPSPSWGLTLSHLSFMTGVWARYYLRLRLAGKKFDIVHGAGYIFPFANVVTAHFCQAREQRLQAGPNGHDQPRTLGQTVRHLDYSLYSRVSSFWENRIYHPKQPRVVIAVSQNVREDLIHEFGFPQDRIVTIPNGVDTQRFHPSNRSRHRAQMRQKLGLKEDDTVAIFVGNSWERKGLRLAIRSIRRIANPALKLLVVGEGNPSQYASPQQLRDPSDKVVFVDRPVNEIQRYYAASDLLVFPSRYEPFGLVVLEAMASGLPVIVSSAAGVAEHLTDGKTGLLVHCLEDEAEIESKIELILSNHLLRQRLEVEGRQLAHQFSWDRIASLTRQVYEQALV